MQEYYLNMEQINLSIAKYHLDMMTDNNSESFINDNRFINNLAHGIAVITHINHYVDSFINTILNSCMEYKGTHLYQCSTDEKLDIIFVHYSQDINKIKSANSWLTYTKTIDVKNELMNLKKVSLNNSFDTPKLTITGTSIKDFFCYFNMEKIYDEYQNLCHLIADSFGLKIKNDLQFITRKCNDDIVNYVYDRGKIDMEIKF